MRPLLAAFVALSLLTTLPAARAQVIDYRSSDNAMNAAIAKARGSLPVFDEAFRAKSAERYSGEVAIPASGGGNEHIWMDVTGVEGGDYRGRIANKPVRIPKMQRGDSYRAQGRQDQRLGLRPGRQDARALHHARDAEGSAAGAGAGAARADGAAAVK